MTGVESSGLGLLGLVAGTAALLTGAVRRYAMQRLLDVPNARSSHRQPTPRGGGLAIVLAYALALAALNLTGILPWPLFMAQLGLVPLATIGFVDDHGHVPARWRLLTQAGVALWALWWLDGLDNLAMGGWVGYGVGVFGVVWMLNLFNFMDGIDGIAAIETITLTLSAAGLMGVQGAGPLPEEGWAALSLAAATAGFLVWNWPPARIFMGDVGSGVLGFVLAVLALWSATRHSLSLVAWLILAGVFLVDATLTLVTRMLRGERWHEAHRSHAYQLAAQRLGSHRSVTLGVLAINVLWLLPMAWIAVQAPNWEWPVLAMAYLPLCLAAFWLGAGQSRG